MASAASALALSLAPRAKQAKTLVIFGAGLQALWHARLVASLAVKLDRIVIASRSISDRSEALVQNLRRHFEKSGTVILGSTIKEAIKCGGMLSQADLICW